jgi:hypothetical protein
VKLPTLPPADINHSLISSLGVGPWPRRRQTESHSSARNLGGRKPLYANYCRHICNNGIENLTL